MSELSELEKGLKYKFKDTSLLCEALRHKSYVNETTIENLRDNERFEFLGDAVLDLAIGHALMIRYPNLKEGDLSRMRAGLVNETTLASISRKIKLGDKIKLSKGETQTGGREKKSILADSLEAIFAAVYLDGGFQSAFEVICSLFSDLIKNMEDDILGFDYKTKFQEMVQTIAQKTPDYRVIAESGPDHDKTFSVELKFEQIKTIGVGKSKKTAEQRAGKSAIEIFENNQHQ